MTSLRTAWPAARAILVITMAMAASLTGLCWALYLDSWIDAEAFVAGMRGCLSFAIGGVIVSSATLFGAALIQRVRQ